MVKTTISVAALLWLAQGATTTKSVWDGVYSRDQASRGQAKYAQVCSNCHQGDLSGSDQAPVLA